MELCDMPDWVAVYRESDGTLVSLGTVVADPLRPGLATINLGASRPEGRTIWNSASLSFDALPPDPPDVDRVDEVLDSLSFRLNNSRATELRTRLERLLGSERFRGVDDPIDLR